MFFFSFSFIFSGSSLQVLLWQGWQWHLLEQPGTGKTLGGEETSSSFSGSSGPIVMAKSHCFFVLSPPTALPSMWYVHRSGQFGPEDLIGAQKMQGR